METFFFWLFAAGMTVSALAVVLNRNPVASALCFVLAIVNLAALFILLHAFFLAAVQILVTAGAVMVLFLFIIMLLDLRAADEAPPRRRYWIGAAAALALGFVYLFARSFAAPGAASPPSAPETAAATPDDTHQVGRLLFSDYLAPFEVTSLLILVATVGVIVLCQDEARPGSGAGKKT